MGDIEAGKLLVCLHVSTLLLQPLRNSQAEGRHRESTPPSKQNRPSSTRQRHDLIHVLAHRGSNSPTTHSCHFETPFLDLVIGQLDLEIQFTIACSNNDMTAFLREIRNTRVKFEIAVILEGLCQADEL